jgi:hypothetical protein
MTHPSHPRFDFTETISTGRKPFVGEFSANFLLKRVQRGQHKGSLWPYSRISRPEPLLFYQVAPQLYSRGWVDPVPDPLILRKSGSEGNRTRSSGSVARNSDHRDDDEIERGSDKRVNRTKLDLWIFWCVLAGNWTKIQAMNALWFDLLTLT